MRSKAAFINNPWYALRRNKERCYGASIAGGDKEADRQTKASGLDVCQEHSKTERVIKRALSNHCCASTRTFIIRYHYIFIMIIIMLKLSVQKNKPSMNCSAILGSKLCSFSSYQEPNIGTERYIATCSLVPKKYDLKWRHFLYCWWCTYISFYR